MKEYLDSRFRKYPLSTSSNWLLTSYINFGADYGLCLVMDFDYDGEFVFNIVAFSDSGYSPDKKLHTIKEDDLLNWVNSFEPTNPNFRYDS